MILQGSSEATSILEEGLPLQEHATSTEVDHIHAGFQAGNGHLGGGDFASEDRNAIHLGNPDLVTPVACAEVDVLEVEADPVPVARWSGSDGQDIRRAGDVQEELLGTLATRGVRLRDRVDPRLRGGDVREGEFTRARGQPIGAGPGPAGGCDWLRAQNDGRSGRYGIRRDHLPGPPIDLDRRRDGRWRATERVC